MEDVIQKKQENLFKKNGLILLLLGSVIFYGGYRIGKQSTFSPNGFNITNREQKNTTVDYNLLWEALNTVQDNYLKRSELDQKQILYGAVSGAVQASGDPYTEFFSPEQLAGFKEDLGGSFTGIGAEITKKNGVITVVTPIEGSPAQKAGILPGDIILKINNETTDTQTVDQAVKKIRGESGTQVTLTIFRDTSGSPFDLTITRGVIEIKSVTLKFEERTGKKIGIIKVNRYGDDTVNLFRGAVDEILKNQVSAVVVDQRNNPGGYLDGAVDLASFWVPKDKTIVTEEGNGKTPRAYNATGNTLMANIPTVVLVNGGSASAAEIFTGALKDYGLATVAGEKTFGKGSVQQIFPLTGGAAVKITIAQWITPKGTRLNHDGISPDVVIESPKTTDNKPGLPNQADMQLEKALDLAATK